MNKKLTLLALIVFFIPLILTAEIPDWSGTWETTYGKLTLIQKDNIVTGWYFLSGSCSVEGEIEESGKLTFKYIEPAASGEGWFELSEDGMSFSGKWREHGSIIYYDWEGYRVGSISNKKWLVILESEWEKLDETEYSFGAMLEAWLKRIEDVEVRHRFIHDVDDMINFCMEAGMLEGSLYLIFASHAEEDGLVLRDEVAGGDEIIEAILYCPNIKLIHFSACKIMNGNIPEQIINSKKTWDHEFIVSGYTESVDWAGSAVIEFFYLNMIFERGFSPEEAANSVIESFNFSGTRSTKWMDACGFTWIKP